LQAAIFFLLAGFLVMLVKSLSTSTSPALAVAYNALGLFLIFQIFLFAYLLAAHVLSPFLKKFPGKRIAAAGLLVCLGLVGFGFIQAQSFTVTRHEIKVRGLARPVNIMHIPDLHLGAQRREGWVKKLIETVERYQPDMVLYNGDMVDSNIALTPELFSLFGSVTAEQYFTTGNHEFHIDTGKAIELIAGAGIRVLRNEMAETHGLQLIGLEYMNADRATYDSHKVNDLSLEEELPKIPRDESKPSVLVHHSPVGLKYVADGNIDVMLSGHTHGGQVFPGTILIDFRFPMNKGRYQIAGTTLLVSQGAGTFGPWMRLGTFNEIQLVKLMPE
jgi:predicted MPP superfamily phosphohydrolase